MQDNEVKNYIVGKTIAHVEIEDKYDWEEMVLVFKDGSSLIITSHSMYEESGLGFKKGSD